MCPTHVHTQAVGTAESWDVYTLETSNSTDGQRNHSCMVQRGSPICIYNISFCLICIYNITFCRDI
jgi:hypothetical protein